MSLFSVFQFGVMLKSLPHAVQSSPLLWKQGLSMLLQAGFAGTLLYECDCGGHARDREKEWASTSGIMFQGRRPSKAWQMLYFKVNCVCLRSTCSIPLHECSYLGGWRAMRLCQQKARGPFF